MILLTVSQTATLTAAILSPKNSQSFPTTISVFSFLWVRSTRFYKTFSFCLQLLLLRIFYKIST